MKLLNNTLENENKRINYFRRQRRNLYLHFLELEIKNSRKKFLSLPKKDETNQVKAHMCIRANQRLTNKTEKCNNTEHYERKNFTKLRIILRIKILEDKVI